jgi:hypothetical protein
MNDLNTYGFVTANTKTISVREDPITSNIAIVAEFEPVKIGMIVTREDIGKPEKTWQQEINNFFSRELGLYVSKKDIDSIQEQVMQYAVKEKKQNE